MDIWSGTNDFDLKVIMHVYYISLSKMAGTKEDGVPYSIGADNSKVTVRLFRCSRQISNRLISYAPCSLFEFEGECLYMNYRPLDLSYCPTK